MPLCLSILQRPDPEVFRNHAHYCGMHAYPHRWAEHRGGLQHPSLTLAHKYGLILQHLRQLDEGDWLLFLDADSVVLRPLPVESLLGEREMLVIDGPSLNSADTRVMPNMFVFRNTPRCRELLDTLLAENGRAISETAATQEDAVLRTGQVSPVAATEAGHYINLSWRFIGWHQPGVQSFVIHLGSLPSRGNEGVLVDEIFHDLRLQSLLSARVNAALIEGEPVFPDAGIPAHSPETMSSYNSGAEIALVTLSTHHIASYAAIAEENMRRYCERHGYACHVYRAVPEALGPEMAGSWAKAWLLGRHLPQHRWVMWVDADMLFFNQSLPLEPLCEGRDVLLARDIGAWPVNSGLMGFRNTPRNAHLLERLWDRIGQVPDKTAVYSSQGDQYYTIEILREEGLLGPESVTDFMTINTPYWLATHDTLLVHVMGLGEPYRSFYMRELDRASLLRG